MNRGNKKTTKAIMGKKNFLNVSIDSHFSPGKKDPINLTSISVVLEEISTISQSVH